MEYKINEVKRDKIYEYTNSLRATRKLIRDRELEKHAEIRELIRETCRNCKKIF